MFPLDYSQIGLVYYPNKILRTKCKAVDTRCFDTNELHEFCAFMRTIAEEYDGIGLAAPQVGVDARMIFIAPNKKNQFFLINPKIIETSERKVLDSEGCLSLPHIFGTVIRPETVIVQAYNEFGEQVELAADKLTARIIQHEIDHINGKLFIDNAVTITGGADKLKALREKANKDER